QPLVNRSGYHLHDDSGGISQARRERRRDGTLPSLRKQDAAGFNDSSGIRHLRRLLCGGAKNHRVRWPINRSLCACASNLLRTLVRLYSLHKIGARAKSSTADAGQHFISLKIDSREGVKRETIEERGN